MARRLTSSLQAVSSSLLMRPTTVVSSANLMKRLELDDDEQSGVRRVKRRGLSTHPWRAPVLSMMVLNAELNSEEDWSECNRAVTIMVGVGRLLQDWDDGGGFKVRGDNSLAQRGVKDVREDICEHSLSGRNQECCRGLGLCMRRCL